jgi:hypothetical protein
MAGFMYHAQFYELFTKISGITVFWVPICAVCYYSVALHTKNQ